MTITAERFEGTAAADPKWVTADYARRFRIDVDATHVAFTSCDPSIQFSAHLWIDQRASDWAASECPLVGCE